MIHSAGKNLHLIVIHIMKLLKNSIMIENGENGQWQSKSSQMLQAECPRLLSHNSASYLQAMYITGTEKFSFLCFTAESKLVLFAVVSFVGLHTWSGN